MSINYKIAVVEDNEDIRELLVNELEKQGYDVLFESDGLQAEKRLLKEKNIDLIIMDLMLPTKDGVSVIQEIRKVSVVPILILSAKDTEFDKIVGLEHGADDYLTKPFSVYELLARVRSILRRNSDYNLQKIEEKDTNVKRKVYNFTLLPDEYAIQKNKQKIQLTNKEYQLLCLFADHPQKIFTKYQIYQQIWEEEFLHDDNVVNVTIRRLRKKIEDDPSDPKCIVTVWGIGYKLGEMT